MPETTSGSALERTIEMNSGYSIVTIPPGDPLVGKSVILFYCDNGNIIAATVYEAYLEGKQHRIKYVHLEGDKKGKKFSATYDPTSTWAFDNPEDALAHSKECRGEA